MRGEAELVKLRAVNKQLRKEIYQTRNLLEVSLELNSALNEDKIIRSYVLNLIGMLSARSVIIVSSRSSYEKYYYPICHQGASKEAVENLVIKKTDPLFDAFQNGEPVIEVKPGVQTELFLKTVVQTGGSVIAPIAHPQKGLLGLAIIGSKHNDHAYARSEITIFRRLTDFLAVAVANSRVYQEMERISLTDPLTGLFNRRYLENHLQKEVSRARRFNHPLSLVMLDIDHFKNFNDRMGHPSGDSLLKRLGGVLLKTVRCHDVVARYGGEEFSVLLPEISEEGALSFSERLRRVIIDYPFENREIQPHGHISISAGTATFPGDGSLSGDLIANADSALYVAKQNGRNQVAAYRNLETKQIVGETK